MQVISELRIKAAQAFLSKLTTPFVAKKEEEIH